MPLQIESKPWNGLTNWQCPFCAHATIGRKSEMVDHIKFRHPDQLRLAELEAEEGKTKKEKAAEAKAAKPEQPPAEPVSVVEAVKEADKAKGGDQ
jgi:hypothetical protein